MILFIDLAISPLSMSALACSEWVAMPENIFYLLETVGIASSTTVGKSLAAVCPTKTYLSEVAHIFFANDTDFPILETVSEVPVTS
jgi:hypothetical protein